MKATQKTQEIVVNTCYGGFSLSAKGLQKYLEKKGLECYFRDSFTNEDLSPEEAEQKTLFLVYTNSSKDKDSLFSQFSIPRDCPTLVEVVKELGTLANSKHSKLKIVEIPEGIEWNIEEYDGNEWISEQHRTWN